MLHYVTNRETARPITLEAAMPRSDAPALFAPVTNALVIAALTASGLLCPEGPRVFYASLLGGFTAIAGFVLAGAWLVTRYAERRADRLQGPRRRPALITREARDTALAAWVAACLLAWPLSRLEAGAPTGL